jgi:hypothetical protein
LKIILFINIIRLKLNLFINNVKNKFISKLQI